MFVVPAKRDPGDVHDWMAIQARRDAIAERTVNIMAGVIVFALFGSVVTILAHFIIKFW